ncbi:MAG: hypothetical protein A2X86_16750 [Bdellovibrionales bacterium GWA2_49_15]|nr:MAG: hypothetical protein A2X86_16750 [Bdellovibrionales bacterium GWA2_49_15]
MIPGWSKIAQLSRMLNLRNRLVLGLTSIILIIVIGQTIILLTEAVVELDYRVATQGTILAQGVATATVGLVSEHARSSAFTNIFERVRRQVDLEELSITDDHDIIVAHSDPTRVGTTDASIMQHVFTSGSAGTRMADLFRGRSYFEVSAPIVRGTYIVGHVRLRFHSHEIAKGIYHQIGLASVMGLFWLAIGWLFSFFYVRRITRPLEVLARAVTAMSYDNFGAENLNVVPEGHDEVVLLQRRFQRLALSLTAERNTNANLMASLREMNLKLYEKVAETTADLQSAMTYLQSIMNCVNVGIVTCDRNGIIVQVNQGATRHLAGLASPMIGTRVDGLIPDGAILGESVAGIVAEGRSCELVLDRTVERGTDGASVFSGKRTVCFRAHPLIGPDQGRLGAVITIEDISEQRLIETRLRRQDRLISMGTMTAGLAHQMGNYLHSIAGFGQLLQKELPAETKSQANAAVIYEESSKAIALLERFLQFARPDESKFRPIPLRPIINDALAMCRYQLTQGDINILNELRMLNSAVACDPQMLEQVFINIFLNAVDAMAGGEKRTLTLSSDVSSDSRFVEISVSDTGIGIEAKNIERIFDPFFTTKGVNGTGLGLSIANQVMELHGGRIEVHTEEKEGTTFTIIMPIAVSEEMR